MLGTHVMCPWRRALNKLISRGRFGQSLSFLARAIFVTRAKNDNDSAIFDNDEADFTPQRGNEDFGKINTDFGKEVLPPGARRRIQL